MPYVGRDQDYEEPLAARSAMWTDLYELTMAQALFIEGTHNRHETYHAFVRTAPFGAGYLVSAGQNIFAEFLDRHWGFTDKDVRILARKTVTDPTTGRQMRVFRDDFLEMIHGATLDLTVDMMPEGEIAFAHEPIARVSGPAWQCLLVESALLNTINSQSLFATYASLLKKAANGKPVLEFGLRRAQAVGGLSPTRGAYIGGADATSNGSAEVAYGINTVGTMAHAYVMTHESEIEAFAMWARHNPHLGVFLVDTYDTLQGVRNAIDVCRERGIQLGGIRLDSGKLGDLAVKARTMMDEAGFPRARIVVSNDLRVSSVRALEEQGAPIDVYAVGTSLATAADQSALGGVYKAACQYKAAMGHEEIAALREEVKAGRIDRAACADQVRDLIKVSEEAAAKATLPGALDPIRHLEKVDGAWRLAGGTICPDLAADPLLPYDQADPFSGRLARMVDSVVPGNGALSAVFNAGSAAYRLLRPMFRAGRLVGAIETVHMARERALSRIAMLGPDPRPAGVERGLYVRQQEMIREAGKGNAPAVR